MRCVAALALICGLGAALPSLELNGKPVAAHGGLEALEPVKAASADVPESQQGVAAEATAPKTIIQLMKAKNDPEPAKTKPTIDLVEAPPFADCGLACDMCEERENSRDRCFCLEASNGDAEIYISDNGGDLYRARLDELKFGNTSNTSVANDVGKVVFDVGNTVWQEFPGDPRPKVPCTYVPTKGNVRREWAEVNKDMGLLASQLEGVTVIMLSWDRATTLRDQILPILDGMPLVREVIVSHGKPATYFETPDLGKVTHVRDFGQNERIGLMRRFASAARVTKTDCVLWMDDDQHPTEEDVTQLYEEWKKEPTVLHGVTARYVVTPEGASPEDSMEYWPHKTHPLIGSFKENLKNEAVPMVLTQFLMGSRQVGHYAYLLSQDRSIQDWVSKESRPLWNGEDIFVNLVSVLKNAEEGRIGPQQAWPRVHRTIIVETDDAHEDSTAISISNSRHYEYRSEAFRRFAAYIQAQAAKKKLSIDFSAMAVRKPTAEAGLNLIAGSMGKEYP